MLPELSTALTIACIVGCGVIGGVFFAFSTFVMGALRRLPPVQGLAAMQAINIVVINPWFLGVFLGTGALCAVRAVWSVVEYNGGQDLLRIASGLAYVLGTLVLTMVVHVPMNSALARVDAQAANAADAWARYARVWTRWNHVRGAAAIVAAGLLAASMY